MSVKLLLSNKLGLVHNMEVLKVTCLPACLSTAIQKRRLTNVCSNVENIACIWVLDCSLLTNFSIDLKFTNFIWEIWRMLPLVVDPIKIAITQKCETFYYNKCQVGLKVSPIIEESHWCQIHILKQLETPQPWAFLEMFRLILMTRERTTLLIGAQIS